MTDKPQAFPGGMLLDMVWDRFGIFWIGITLDSRLINAVKPQMDPAFSFACSQSVLILAMLCYTQPGQKLVYNKRVSI